jgi:hypothetical protein
MSKLNYSIIKKYEPQTTEWRWTSNGAIFKLENLK